MSNIESLYRLIPLKVIRRTNGVLFDNVPIIEGLTAMDRVIHDKNAISPGPVDNVSRPWYMHPHQEDNLLVLYGKRQVDLYTPEYGEIAHFEVYKDNVILNGKTLYEGPCILGWPTNVFHRVQSGMEGSSSINFARREEGFDIATNFSIYDVNTETGEYKVIRPGHLDQP